MTELTQLQAVELNACLAMIKNTGLSVESLRNILKLKKLLKEKIEEVNELRLAVMEKYDVKPTGNSYLFDKHPKAVEIGEDLKNINTILHDVKPLNFMTESELFNSTPEVNMDVLQVLIERIVKS